MCKPKHAIFSSMHKGFYNQRYFSKRRIAIRFDAAIKIKKQASVCTGLQVSFFIFLIKNTVNLNPTVFIFILSINFLYLVFLWEQIKVVRHFVGALQLKIIININYKLYNYVRCCFLFSNKCCSDYFLFPQHLPVCDAVCCTCNVQLNVFA